jgi:hypothetical protein
MRAADPTAHRARARAATTAAATLYARSALSRRPDRRSGHQCIRSRIMTMANHERWRARAQHATSRRCYNDVGRVGTTVCPTRPVFTRPRTCSAPPRSAPRPTRRPPGAPPRAPQADVVEAAALVVEHPRDRVRWTSAHELDATQPRELLVRLRVPAHGTHHEGQAVGVGAREVRGGPDLVEHGRQASPERGDGREAFPRDLERHDRTLPAYRHRPRSMRMLCVAPSRPLAAARVRPMAPVQSVQSVQSMAINGTVQSMAINGVVLSMAISGNRAINGNL